MICVIYLANASTFRLPTKKKREAFHVADIESNWEGVKNDSLELINSAISLIWFDHSGIVLVFLQKLRQELM